MDIHLLDPFIAGDLDFVVTCTKSSDFSISLSVSGHLLGSIIGSCKDLQVLYSSFVRGANSVVQSLDFIEAGRLEKAFSCSLLGLKQPGSELLDTSPVLSPVLDIIGILVTLSLGVSIQVSHILGDSSQFILEGLSVFVNLVTLRKEALLYFSVLLDNLDLSRDILLQVHSPGHTILRKHRARCCLDVIQFSSGLLHPFIERLKRVIKVGESSAELIDLGDGRFETASNLKLGFNCVNLLGDDLLLVRKSNGHTCEVGVDIIKQTSDGVVALLEQVLSKLKIGQGSFKVVLLLDLLDLLLSNLKLAGNSLVVGGIPNPGFLGVIKKLQPRLGLLLGVIPALLNTLDIAFQELGFVGVLQDALTLSNEVRDNTSLGVKLCNRLLLSLNKFIHILDTGWSNVASG